MQDVILVDEHDAPVGLMEKMEAHRKGLLHRAYSVFIFNNNGEMLLQQRALTKYHCGGLWTNTCCSHPYSGEDIKKAAGKRLFEEMGFTTLIEKIFDFIYKAEFDNGLIEHEYDHVFIGYYDGTVAPEKNEVHSYKYVAIPELLLQISTNPNSFTPWFKIALPNVLNYIKKVA
jgi:isopentenyl-diphosphate Delta-isomerase